MPEWIHTLTVDASRDARRKVTGIGIVIQERTGAKGRGPILAQISEAHRGVTGGHDEAFAILRALEIARERSFTRIKVRSDYNQLRRKLRKQHRQGAGTAGEGLHSQILCLAREFVWIDFGYVPRRKNQIAHHLARKGRNLEPPEAPLPHEDQRIVELEEPDIEDVFDLEDAFFEEMDLLQRDLDDDDDTPIPF